MLLYFIVELGTGVSNMVTPLATACLSPIFVESWVVLPHVRKNYVIRGAGKLFKNGKLTALMCHVTRNWWPIIV
jgi:hypothetical protein